MSIVIRTNPTAMKALRSLNKTSRGLNDNVARLSTGKRINSAKDDAAGLAISESLGAQVSSLRQASRNAAGAISVLQTAEGAMGEIAGTLVRMREIGMQAASGHITDNQRDFVETEFQIMRAEVDRISDVTEFNGQKLLDGSLSATFAFGKAMEFQIGINNTDNDTLDVNIEPMSAKGLGLHLANFKTQDQAGNSLGIVDKAIDIVSRERANLGANMNRLEITMDNLASAAENLQGAQSRILDVDVGKEMGKMVSNQILAQAGASMLAQANSSPQVALSLIG
jgi:flagellin